MAAVLWLCKKQKKMLAPRRRKLYPLVNIKSTITMKHTTVTVWYAWNDWEMGPGATTVVAVEVVEVVEVAVVGVDWVTSKGIYYWTRNIRLNSDDQWQRKFREESGKSSPEYHRNRHPDYHYCD